MIVIAKPTFRDAIYRWRRTLTAHTTCALIGHKPHRRGLGFVGEHGEYPASYFCTRCGRPCRHDGGRWP